MQATAGFKTALETHSRHMYDLFINTTHDEPLLARAVCSKAIPPCLAFTLNVINADTIYSFLNLFLLALRCDIYRNTFQNVSVVLQ